MNWLSKKKQVEKDDCNFGNPNIFCSSFMALFVLNSLIIKFYYILRMTHLHAYRFMHFLVSLNIFISSELQKSFFDRHYVKFKSCPDTLLKVDLMR